jgi:hypothetical protein
LSVVVVAVAAAACPVYDPGYKCSTQPTGIHKLLHLSNSGFEPSVFTDLFLILFRMSRHGWSRSLSYIFYPIQILLLFNNLVYYISGKGQWVVGI